MKKLPKEFKDKIENAMKMNIPQATRTKVVSPNSENIEMLSKELPTRYRSRVGC